MSSLSDKLSLLVGTSLLDPVVPDSESIDLEDSSCCSYTAWRAVTLSSSDLEDGVGEDLSLGMMIGCV